jgi:hypothetical protein
MRTLSSPPKPVFSKSLAAELKGTRECILRLLPQRKACEREKSVRKVASDTNESERKNLTRNGAEPQNLNPEIQQNTVTEQCDEVHGLKPEKVGCDSATNEKNHPSIEDECDRRGDNVTDYECQAIKGFS